MASYLWTSYANTTAEGCFELEPAGAQVACSSQHLNITDPPSYYSWEEYPFLWEPITCMLSNVTYSHRVDIPDNFNFCTIPLKGSDAFLFAALALITAGCLFGKLSAVWVLVAGAIVGTVNYYANLLHVSNGIAVWLGISPPDLFFFAFLPPLLVDSAIRIDFFMFTKLWVHILMMAFVMVVMSAIILTPLILFALDFSSRGFTWVHGALFAAMIASTDALAATAILKQGGGPEKLVVLMEGEALLNDASAITLFEVFMHLLEDLSPEHGVPTVWSAIPTIIEDILKLASIGAAVGLAMSIATGYLLRWLRWRGAKPAVELTIVLAVAYLSFYVGQSPAHGSGVISVVVFGLWGNYTSKWGMLASTEESGAFDAFWDTVAFASNGLVFFWSGIAAINYFIRSIDILGGNAWSYAAIPLIYIFMVLIRSGCLALYNVTVFAWIRERLGWAEVLFTGWAGLRGSISLIMTADFIAHSAFLQGTTSEDMQLDRVNSDIAIWTASFVFLTLVINAPSISLVMHWLRLDRIAPEKQAMRAKAKRALLRFTGAAIGTLREDDEEFLQGANWEAVAQYVDVSGALRKFDPPPPPPGAGGVTVVVTPGEGGDGGGGDGGGGDGGGEGKAADTPLARKSIVHSVTQALLAPLAPFVAAGGGGETDGGGGFETDASQRSRRRAMGLFRASSAAAGLGRTTSATKERSGRSRRRRHRRHTAAGRAFAGGAGFSSDDSSDSAELDESDASGYSSDSSSAGGRSLGSSPRGSLFADDGDADLLLGEALGECPFIQGGVGGTAVQNRQSQPPGTDAAAAAAGAAVAENGDIEMGLRAAAAPPPEAAAAGVAAAAAAAAAVAGAAAGAAAAAAAAVAPRGGAEQPPEVPATAPRPSPPPPPPEEDDDALSAEHAAFIRLQRQRRQQQQQQRPALGSLFSSDGEPPESPGGGVARGGSGAFPRAGSLQAIAEHSQQEQEQQAAADWHQQAPQPPPGAAAGPPSEADGGAYYSSLPAAAGRQLAAQLNQHQLQERQAAREAPDQQGASGGAGGGGGGAPADDAAYYSSMPAAVGRQVAQQLQREMAGGEAAAAAPSPAEEEGAAEDSGGPHGGAASLRAPPPDAQPPPGYYSSLPAAAGRQLGAQLRQEMAAAEARAGAAVAAGAAGPGRLPPHRPTTPSADAGPPSLGYYSSVPAAVGRQLAQQLRQEQAAARAAEAPEPQQEQERQAVAGGEVEPPAGYYSSLPAAAGRSLQQQLQQRLAAARQAAAAEPAAAEPAGQPDAERPASVEEAEAPSRPPSQSAADSYSTMPAALGRSVQRQLAAELGQQGSLEAPGGTLPSQQPGAAKDGAGASPAAAAGGVKKLGSGGDVRRPPRPGRMARQVSQPPEARPAWEDYHRTVTGAAGPSLAAELQRQLSATRGAAVPSSAAAAAAAGPLTARPQRDLLGRRIAAAPAGGAAGGADVSGLAPLSARSSHRRAPSGDSGLAAFSPRAMPGVASVLPAATPLSAHLHMRRARSMAPGRRGGDPPAAHTSGPASYALPLPAGAGLEVGAAHLHPASRSDGRPHAQEISWQHRPMRAMRSLSRPSLQRTSASMAAAAAAAVAEVDGVATPAGSQQGGPPSVASAGPPAPGLLSRTYSGMGLSAGSGGGGDGGSARKSARAAAALARFSYAGSAGSGPGSSMHGGPAFNAAMAAASPSGGGAVAFTPSLSKASTAHYSEGLLAEMRSRLIAGVKRYFHAKRMEGLLSSKGLRILEYACDHAAERTHGALSMWRLLEKEVAGNLSTRVMAQSLMLVARSWRASPRWLQVATSWPVKKLSGFLRRLLGQRMLVSCEVAVEYYLAMIHSPQIQWLQQADDAWPLQQEVEGEVDAAYRFIIDREIEAPDRFQAIQSYRAAMAVLRQQLTFVQELYDSGMVDGGEKDDMVAPLDKRMRHLEITGPVWKPPRPRAVLRGLPFMQALPDQMFQAILKAGTIKEYKTGAAFWSSSDLPSLSELAAGPGAYVVLSGVVRRIHHRPDGTMQEYFQGIGGVIGALLATTGTRLPGQETAVAEGNTLGKGPMLFHVPQGAVVDVLQRAAGDDPDASLLRLQLLRLAAAYVCESCEQDVTNAMYLHLVQLAAAKAQRSLRRRSALLDAGQPGSAAPGSPCATQRQPSRVTLQLPAAPAASEQPQRPRDLGRTSSLARLSSWQRRGSGPGAEDAEEEQGGAGRRPSGSAILLHRQSAAPGTLRTSKSFGGQLAELMQQIATEEFEEMGGAGQHGQAGAGYDDGAATSPHPSDGTGRGGSAADLPGLSSEGGAAAVNGHGRSLQEPRLSRKSLAAGDSVDHAKPAASAAKAVGKAMRQRVRAAERRAPQYAVEVLAELKRGLPSGTLLELPAGIHFSQTTHVVLLRGQLLAAGPPLASDDSSPSGSPPGSPSVSGGLRSSMELAASGLSVPRGSSALRRVSLGAAGGGEADREAWVAEAAAAAAAPAAPCLLPWLWNPRYRCSGGARPVLEQLWRAGDSGALLLVCLTDSGEVPSGVGEAETAAEEAAAAAAAEAAAEAAAAAAASQLESHPVDISTSSGSHHLRADVPVRVSGGGAAVRSMARVASVAAAPASQATSSLMRLMPWQHRMSRSRTAPKDVNGTANMGADTVSLVPSSGTGNGHGSLRLPLERLASRRHDSSSRSFNSAR